MYQTIEIVLVFEWVYVGPFLSDTRRVSTRGYYGNSRVWNTGRPLFSTLCVGVGFPEPGEMWTYCFAMALWHLMGRMEIGVRLSICTGSHSGTGPVLSGLSQGYLVVLPWETLNSNLRKRYLPLSLTQFFIPKWINLYLGNQSHIASDI